MQPPRSSPPLSRHGRGRRRQPTTTGAAAAACALRQLPLLLALAVVGVRGFQLPPPARLPLTPSAAPPSGPPSSRAVAAPAPATARTAVCLAATPRRGGGRRMDDDEEEDYEAEDDEVSRIVGYGDTGRPLRRNRNQILEWLRELYHKIFWFGLEGLADDNDDYYLDKIDWLGDWNKPQDVGGKTDWTAEEEAEFVAAYDKGGSGRLFRGAFPFDRQTYPPTAGPKKGGKKRPHQQRAGDGEGDEEDDGDDREVVLRKVGEREETPLWSNTVRPSRDSGRAGARRATAAAPSARGVKAGSSRKNPALELGKLEERKQVLTVSRDVWKRRVAEALRETATGGGSGKKLAEARARLQEVDQELEDLDVEMRELRALITAPFPAARAAAAASASSSAGGGDGEEEDADEEDEDNRI